MNPADWLYKYFNEEERKRFQDNFFRELETDVLSAEPSKKNEQVNVPRETKLNQTKTGL